jgi:hypothetical protein
MAMVTDVGPRLGIAPTCRALGLSRATYYRSKSRLGVAGLGSASAMRAVM